MIPCVGVVISGKKYYPLMNNGAMFRLQESFPPDVLDKISEDDTKAGFKLAFDVFSVLCEEGAAARRYYGYDPGPVPVWEDADVTWLPRDIKSMKAAIYMAVTLGYTSERPATEDDDIDLELLELEKKTG